MKNRASVLYPVKLPQCDASRDSAYANDKKGKIYQCTHQARYEIDGHNFCTKHAGVAALHILLGADLRDD